MSIYTPGEKIHECLFKKKDPMEVARNNIANSPLTEAIENPLNGIINHHKEMEFSDIYNLFLNMERNFFAFVFIRRIDIEDEKEKYEYQIKAVEEYEDVHIDDHISKVLKIIKGHKEFKKDMHEMIILQEALIEMTLSYGPVAQNIEYFYNARSYNKLIKYIQDYTSRYYKSYAGISVKPYKPRR